MVQEIQMLVLLINLFKILIDSFLNMTHDSFGQFLLRQQSVNALQVCC